MVFALSRPQILKVVLKNFCRGLNNAQGRAELVRHHRYDMAPQLAQLPLPGERSEQFKLRPLALCDVGAETQNVRLTVDFDNFGRQHNRVDRAPPGAKPALYLSHRTIAPKIRQELFPLVTIQPDP